MKFNPSFSRNGVFLMRLDLASSPSATKSTFFSELLRLGGLTLDRLAELIKGERGANLSGLSRDLSFFVRSIWLFSNAASLFEKLPSFAPQLVSLIARHLRYQSTEWQFIEKLPNLESLDFNYSTGVVVNPQFTKLKKLQKLFLAGTDLSRLLPISDIFYMSPLKIPLIGVGPNG